MQYQRLAAIKAKNEILSPSGYLLYHLAGEAPSQLIDRCEMHHLGAVNRHAGEAAAFQHGAQVVYNGLDFR
jgi:hypothetical protein